MGSPAALCMLTEAARARESRCSGGRSGVGLDVRMRTELTCMQQHPVGPSVALLTGHGVDCLLLADARDGHDACREVQQVVHERVGAVCVCVCVCARGESS
jgi:hypothetical protein